MKGEIELYNISFLILKVELHFKACFEMPFEIKQHSALLKKHLFFRFDD